MFMYLLLKIDDLENSMVNRNYMNYMHVRMNIINRYGTTWINKCLKCGDDMDKCWLK